MSSSLLENAKKALLSRLFIIASLKCFNEKVTSSTFSRSDIVLFVL